EGSQSKKDKFKAGLANNVIMTDINERFSLGTVYQWLDTLIAALDCYYWVFSQGYLNPMLFQDQIIVRLLNFITALWSKYPKDTPKAFDPSFWSRDLMTLILTCALDPAQLGFDVNNEEVDKKLPKVIESLLKAMTTYLSENILKPLHDVTIEMTMDGKKFNLVHELDSGGNMPVRWGLIHTIVRGYKLLHDARLLSKPKNLEQYTKQLWATMLRKMINHEQKPYLTKLTLDLENQKGLQSLFEYIIYLGIEPSEILPHFFEPALIQTDSGLSTVGTYLLSLFKHQITSWLAAKFYFIIENIHLFHSKKSSSTTFDPRPVVSFLITTLDLFSSDMKIRQTYGSQFIDGIYNCWPKFSSLWEPADKALIDDKLLIVTLLTKTFIINSKCLLTHQQFDTISDMYLTLITDKTLNLSYKNRLLDLLVFFASINFSADEQTSETIEKQKEWNKKLFRQLLTFTANNFPMYCKEFKEGTQDYYEFHMSIKKITAGLELSSSFLIFELLVSMLCREKQHSFEDEILKSISHFVLNTKDDSKQIEIFQYIYDVIYNEKKNVPSEHRLHALDKLVLKILTSMRKQCVIEVYKRHILVITSIIEAEFRLETSTTAIESSLINRICSFRLMEHMYTILTKDDVQGSTSPIVSIYEKIRPNMEKKDGKELTKNMIRRSRIHFTDGEKIMKIVQTHLTTMSNSSEKTKSIISMIRTLYTSSFNCLISLFICTQTELKLYTAFIFQENPNKNEYFYENIIDADETYDFPVELPEYYKKDKRTVLSVLRKKILLSSNSQQGNLQIQNQPPPRYLSSEYLCGSSLASELAIFDYISSAVVSQQQQQQQQTNLNKSISLSQSGSQTFLSKIQNGDSNGDAAILEFEDDNTDFLDMEVDKLNQHPCMVMMICLLKHMEHNHIIPTTIITTGENGSTTTTNGTGNIVHSQPSSMADMPTWMSYLHKKFSDPTTHTNIKLFLLRLIVHTHTIFKPYSRFWLTSIIQLCNSLFENSATVEEGINTFILDVLVVLLSWHTVAIPSEIDSTPVQRLISNLFVHCSHKNSAITKSNLDLIKRLVEYWKPRIQSPTQILCKLISDQDQNSRKNSIGIQLTATLVANNIHPYSFHPEITEDRFNETLVKNLKNNFRIIYAAAAEVVGMLLKCKKLKSESNTKLLEQIDNAFKGLQQQDRIITCLYSIQKHYPDIIDNRYMNQLMFALKRLHGDLKMECLEAMEAGIADFEHAYKELKTRGILDIIAHKDFGIRVVALRLLYKLLPKLNVDQMYEVGLVISIDGPNECQNWALEIYKWMYDYLIKSRDLDVKENATQLLNAVREQLLRLLLSKNEVTRLNCRNFWCEPSHLPTSTVKRLPALVTLMYSNKTEQEYLNYCTNFLLERTTHSPDYNRLIFDQPLEKCVFHDFPLTCNWRQRHHTYMTPLFTQDQTVLTATTTAAGMLTSRSLMSMDPVHLMQTLSSTTTDEQQQLLATQDIFSKNQFIPTQQLEQASKSSYNWLKQSNTLDTASTFALPTMQTHKNSALLFDIGGDNKRTKLPSQTQQAEDSEMDADIFRLKRRFLKDSKQLSNYFIKKQYEKKRQETEMLNDVKLKQDNQVEKYRSYRIGELPDIQIKYSDIIIPLQALAQYDNYTARILYSNLFIAILQQIESRSKDEYLETLASLSYGFKTILSNSEIYYPSFIAALLDIILAKAKHVQIEPEFISGASIASGLEPVGILAIESFIPLQPWKPWIQPKFEPLESQTPSKRQRLVCDPNETAMWLELAKCYRSLSNYEDVHGIFSKTPGIQSSTRDAIREESRGNFQQALNSYITAMNEADDQSQMVTDEYNNLHTAQLAEQEFWQQSALKCCNYLTNWSVMEKRIFLDDTTFDTLWSDIYQVNFMMPYAIRSKLKLLITGTEEQQAQQEDLCQFFNNLSLNSISTSTSETTNTFVKRSYIEKQYPYELATFYLYQKDFDRSKYYIQYAKEQFLSRWSTISRLCEHGRKHTIQYIQAYYELEQFLSFVEQNHPLLKTIQQIFSTNENDTDTIRRFQHKLKHDLIEQWQLPDIVRNTIHIWDDIITNRSLFLDVIDDIVSSSTHQSTNLKIKEFDSLLIDYKVRSSLDLAYCALKQRNYKLATTKLSDTQKKLDFCKQSDLLRLYWHEIYCDVHLKRNQANKTNGLSSLLDTLVAKELKKMDSKIEKLKVCDEHTAHLNMTYVSLNIQFCRTVIDSLLDQPQSYADYEGDAKLSKTKSKQLEFYLNDSGDSHSTSIAYDTNQLISSLFQKCVNTLKSNIQKQEERLPNTVSILKI
ncbi:unnamed protein product, partial [Didymodactylos carnosus]